MVAWLVGAVGHVTPPSLLPNLKLGFFLPTHLPSTCPGFRQDCLKGKPVGGSSPVVNFLPMSLPWLQAELGASVQFGGAGVGCDYGCSSKI